MENRSLKELYTILFKYSEKNGFSRCGICFQIGNLNADRLINYKEDCYLRNNLLENKPKLDLHTEFFNHKDYRSAKCYWWEKGEAEQRLLFIQKMIEINS